MFNPMPTINLEALKSKLSAEDFALITGIVATRGKNKGQLRASKPELKMVEAMGRHGKYQRPTMETGSTAYIWRMVAFTISPIRSHHCLPVMADFDLPVDNHDERRALAKRLDKIADVVCSSVPKNEWHGTMSWGRVMGMPLQTI